MRHGRAVEAVGGSSEAERSVFHTQYRLGPLEDRPHPQTAESGAAAGERAAARQRCERKDKRNRRLGIPKSVSSFLTRILTV